MRFGAREPVCTIRVNRLGSFLFKGPSGVGKTELAKTLAEALFGSEAALVRIDLSEFTEQHSVSRLLGAPPGYAGHDEPGQLTEPVRRRPYCVVLFDELEKAHPDVAAVLLQILDDGRVTDAKGRTIDFRHALIVLTTNLEDDELPFALRPELVNRIDEIVRFEPLGLPQIEAIVAIHVDALAARARSARRSLCASPTSSAFPRRRIDGGRNRSALRTAHGFAPRFYSALDRNSARHAASRKHRGRRPPRRRARRSRRLIYSINQPRLYVCYQGTRRVVGGESASACGLLTPFESVIHEAPA